MTQKIDSMFRLVGVQEPFLIDLSSNRLFANAREENYSDYLAWLIDQFSENTEWFLRLFKISENELKGVKLKGTKPIIKRESYVEEGYEEQSGRLDILILYENEKVLIDIEVKVKDADSAIKELEKHKGYRKSLENKYPKEIYKHFHRLLVTDANQEYYNNESENQEEWYYVIKWLEVCESLRQFILSGVPKNKQILKSLIVAFVGTVEQALLGYRSLESLDNRKYIDEKSSEYISKLANKL